jgi:hypothetical protein
MSTFRNITAAAASLVLLSGIAHAQIAVPTHYSINNSGDFGVKYLGSDGDYLVFEVKIQSPLSDNASFRVEDSNDGTLYTSRIKDASKLTRVKIEKKDYQALNFKLVVGSKVYSKSFSVNTKMIDRTTVSESDITKL